MARRYQSVFSRLAQSYAVTVVAGSTVLPSPFVLDGRVRAREAPLYGVTAVFAPDGRAHGPLVRKMFPTGVERPFMTAGSVDALPAFEIPAGRFSPTATFASDPPI